MYSPLSVTIFCAEPRHKRISTSIGVSDQPFLYLKRFGIFFKIKPNFNRIPFSKNRFFASMKLSNKNKQFLVLLSKILIIIGAFYFIYHQLASNDKLNWSKFKLIFNKNFTAPQIFFILFLSFLNRFLEILKWQNLVGSFSKITVAASTKQVLAALTLGVFTPVGSGEYVGKALYFEKSKTPEIIFLNLICNGIQMVVTSIFGLIGMLVLGYFLWAFGFITVFSIAVFFIFKTKSKKIKGFSIQQLLVKINQIPKAIHQKNNLLGLGRYLVFTHQFYFLLLLFDVSAPYYLLFATIILVYFLASIIPSFQFLDFALKGGLSIYFFNLLGVNEWIIVFITSLMWFLNVALPVIMGSFYVIKFKPKWN
jgi:hypothetical protein